MLKGPKGVPQADEVYRQITSGGDLSPAQVIHGMPVWPEQPPEADHKGLAGSIRKQQALCLKHLPAGLRFWFRNADLGDCSLSGSENGGAANKE